jgi:hypothetical protein
MAIPNGHSPGFLQFGALNPPNSPLATVKQDHEKAHQTRQNTLIKWA